MRYLKLAAVFLALSVLAVNTSYAAGANKKIKVGVSVATMKEAVYSFMKKAMMDNKDKYDAEIYWVAANNDEMAQVANVEDLLAQGIDVLILHPVNTVAAGSLVEKARKENVPVISMDRLPINANVNCHVTANSFLVGQAQAKYLADKLNGKGNIVILEGEAGNDVAKEITAGNKDILKNYPGMKIVVDQTHKAWSRDLAMATTENALTNYKDDIQGILANNSGMIMGAVQAILAEGMKGKVVTVGSDADKDSCQAIIDGTNSADVDKEPYQLGLITFETAVKVARGEKIETDTTVQNGKYKVPVKFTPVRIITKENVKDMKDRWPDLKF
jgi:ABC-type sugar transport system substrate-binding protein